MLSRQKTRSLNSKLMVIAFTAFLPVFFALLYSLYSLHDETSAYSDITRSVTYANGSLDFKERMDYSMYLAVVRKKDFRELGDGKITVNGIMTVNPYKSIREMKERCGKLSDMATTDSNRSQIIRLHNTLESLSSNVSTLEHMISGEGSYEENMSYLDDNIYMLTTVIEEGIQGYIREETENLQKIRTEQEQHNKSVYILCIILSGAAIAATYVLTARAVKSVTRPIHEICESTKKVAEGDFTVRAHNANIHELKVLTDSFNNMTDKIGTLVDNIKEQEKNLHLMETKLLQEQINPHFLYNTLDGIVWLAESNRNEEAVAMVTSLSEFFRMTLAHGRDFITVREEKIHIESYLKIQGFRYQDIMDYEIEMEESILDARIPKLLLQPVVENALYHGVKMKRGKSRILVRGFCEGENLMFQVIDNGKGMKQDELEALQNHIEKSIDEQKNSSFGLHNINQRIKHYYGDMYGLSIESQVDKGTKVTITIPGRQMTLS